jgi:ribosome maturation factor RimP
MSDLLDEIDPIDHAYIFEVSSPGIDRPLKTEWDYKKNLNKLVEVKLFSPMDGKKLIEAILIGHTEDTVELELDNNKLTISKKDIAIIRPVINF